jgi:hypothetical protein
MHSRARHVLKKVESETENQRQRLAPSQVKLTVLQSTSVADLLPKEVICCILAAD